MRTINCQPYQTDLPATDAQGRPRGGTLPFDMRASLVAVLFLGPYDAAGMIARQALATQIERTDAPELAVTDEQLEWLTSGIETYIQLEQRQGRPVGRHFVEFFNRVLHAPTRGEECPVLKAV